MDASYRLSSNAKPLNASTELHLGRRGISHLTDDMEAFESLEVTSEGCMKNFGVSEHHR